MIFAPSTVDPATEAHGPIDYLLIEFSPDRITGEAAAAVLELVERGLIRLYDVVVIAKDADGSVTSIELDGAAVGGFGALAGARSGLVDEEDVHEAASAMEPGTLAVLMVYENSWAAPFVAALHRNGAEVIAGARIPAADVMAALDTTESTD